MYYVLAHDYPVDENGGYYFIEDGLEFEGVGSWALGRPFSQPPPRPILVNLVPIEGFTGEPPEMKDGYMLLMSNRLVDTLKEAGVDNIDCYPAILRDEVNDREFNYQAVNILGLLQVADLGKSEWENHDGEAKLDTHFERLVVDEKEALGQYMFRMAEDTGSILVSDRIKQALEKAGVKGLLFRPTS